MLVRARTEEMAGRRLEELLGSRGTFRDGQVIRVFWRGARLRGERRLDRFGRYSSSLDQARRRMSCTIDHAQPDAPMILLRPRGQLYSLGEDCTRRCTHATRERIRERSAGDDGMAEGSRRLSAGRIPYDFSYRLCATTCIQTHHSRCCSIM